MPWGMERTMKSTRSHPISRHSRAPLRGARRTALVVLAALAPVVGLLVVAQPASSAFSPDQGTRATVMSTTDNHHTTKVFVCKYVGTPGVDETLKAGKQPLYVSSSATVGTYFKDEQGRSYVLAVATDANTGKGRTYTGDLTCPAPLVLTAPSATAPTCTADGALVVPRSTEAVTYSSEPAGTGPGTYTVTARSTSHGRVDATEYAQKNGRDHGKVITTWTVTVLPQLTGDECLTQVAPVDPTVVPSTKCGVEGSYTIPTTTGISYLLTGTTIAAGTYPGPASGTVTAVATTGYVLTTPGWSVALSVPAAAPCAQAVITVVTPVDPTVAASTTCEVQGSYTIPATTGITYRLGGEVVKAGPYVGPASGTVTAEANPGYTLSTTGWSFTLTVAAPAICPEAAAPAVEAPATGTTATTTTTTAALPKTGAPVATLGIAGVLALLLGLALMAVGTRRPVRDLS